MRKTLKDLAAYLNDIILPEAGGEYAVKPEYLSIADEDSIRRGVNAFRAFLIRVYDRLIEAGDEYDHHAKVAHEYENRTTLSGYYPFLNNVKNLLMRIGYRGVLSGGGSLTCDGKVLCEKLGAPKTIDCLRFLAGCGLAFGGLDLNKKKPALADLGEITISYPDDPAMLTGMKVMAVAEIDFGTLKNQDTFMRCDYTVLMRDKTDAYTVLQNTLRPLPAPIRDFVLELHGRYTDIGAKCAVEIKGFHIYIKYIVKRKDAWGINASLNNGYHINVKPLAADKYPDTVAALHPYLRGIIAEGYGCGRKRPEIGHCDGGCRGLTIPLNESILDMRGDIIKWFDEEVSAR